MPGGKSIVRAFTDAGETRETFVLTQRMKLAAAAGKEFMGIGLMPDIPDYFILRCIKDIMHGDSQFNNPEIRRQVAAALETMSMISLRISPARVGRSVRDKRFNCSGLLILLRNFMARMSPCH